MLTGTTTAKVFKLSLLTANQSGEICRVVKWEASGTPHPMVTISLSNIAVVTMLTGKETSQ